MEQLKEKANKYVEEKAIEVLKEAYARVYADGYRDGYKDREAETPFDLLDNNTEYVDLGLESGTLWSTDYEKEGGITTYVAYEKAQEYEIPTSEQCKELFENCEFIHKDRLFYCIGPNGKFITFSHLGYKEIGNEPATYTVASLFWIIDNENNNAVRLLEGRTVKKEIYNVFSGFKIPIRLVHRK